MSWKTVTLGDISSNIQTGPFGSQLHQSDYSEEGTPVVMPKDLVNGHISEASIARVSEDHVNRLNRHKIEVGDILYSRRGDVGRCAFATETEEGWLCGTGCLRVTIDISKAIPKFVFYQLQKAETVGWVEKHAVGATMLNLNTSILSSVPIEIPPLAEQQVIVDMLSAYDDLIENNQKQIKLLEEAAQRLYKEWFVDLRFPGHETTPITDGIPEGWRETTIGDETEVKRGGSPRPIQEYLSDEGLNWLKISDATASSSPFIYQIKEKIKPEGLKKTVFMKAGTIILSNSATPGIPKILKIDTCIHDGWLYFPNLKLSNEYMYHLFLQIRSDLVSRGTGAVFTNLRTDILKKYRFIRPADHILELFSKQVKPIFSEIDCLHQQVLLMTEARDRLLPKLMS